MLARTALTALVAFPGKPELSSRCVNLNGRQSAQPPPSAGESDPVATLPPLLSRSLPSEEFQPPKEGPAMARGRTVGQPTNRQPVVGLFNDAQKPAPKVAFQVGGHPAHCLGEWVRGLTRGGARPRRRWASCADRRRASRRGQAPRGRSTAHCRVRIQREREKNDLRWNPAPENNAPSWAPKFWMRIVWGRFPVSRGKKCRPFRLLGIRSMAPILPPGNHSGELFRGYKRGQAVPRT